MSGSYHEGGGIQMRFHLLIGILVCAFFASPLTQADGGLSVLQERMAGKILEMEDLVEEMENESDGWKLRSMMQQHAKIMEESANLASEIAAAEYQEAEHCLKKQHSVEDFKDCSVPAEFQNTQYKLLVVLMRHVIRRQNIIMEKVGIFR
jgi:hypothetical protein